LFCFGLFCPLLVKSGMGSLFHDGVEISFSWLIASLDFAKTI